MIFNFILRKEESPSKIFACTQNQNFFTAKGFNSHCTRIGSGDLKIVMLHGWNGVRDWKPFEDSFGEIATSMAKQSNVEVIVLDLPGFGASGRSVRRTDGPHMIMRIGWMKCWKNWGIKECFFLWAFVWMSGDCAVFVEIGRDRTLSCLYEKCDSHRSSWYQMAADFSGENFSLSQ